MLGSQPLAALRDAVRCPADDNMRAVGLASPSAYLHLEDAFFNDLRAPGAADLSAPVRAFCGAMRLRPPPPAAPRAEAALDAGAGPRRVQGPAGEVCELMSRCRSRAVQGRHATFGAYLGCGEYCELTHAHAEYGVCDRGLPGQAMRARPALRGPTAARARARRARAPRLPSAPATWPRRRGGTWRCVSGLARATCIATRAAASTRCTLRTRGAFMRATRARARRTRCRPSRRAGRGRAGRGLGSAGTCGGCVVARHAGRRRGSG